MLGKHLAVPVARIRHSIRVQNQHIARFQVQGLGRIFGSLHRTDQWTGGMEFIEDEVLADDVWKIVPGVEISQAPAVRIQDCIE